MRRALDRFYKGCGLLSCISIIALVSFVAIQVLLNFIDVIAEKLGLAGLGLMIPSYSTFSGYALAFATFLALAPAIRGAAHIRVTLLQERLPLRLQRIVLTLIAAIGTLVGVLMTWALGTMALESWEFGDKSSGLVSISLWIPQSVLAFGSFAMLIACLDTTFEMLRFGRSPSFNDTLSDESKL